jgi:ribose transport system ATP-binding protein
MKKAARDGAGILFVTHRLEEVQAVTESVTVLRDGAVVDTARTNSLSERQLIERIIGGTLGELYPSRERVERGALLRISDLSARWVEDFSLEAGQGEIIGLTGLLGMGQEEIPYLLFGEHRAMSGSIEIEREALDLTTISPAEAMRAGIILLPGNRLEQGAAGEATVMENVTLPTLRRYYKRGLLRTREEKRRARQLLRRFGVTPADPTLGFLRLSGGNQQKALIAKWFETQPKVMLLDEPTRGVDVGARKEIFRHIKDASENGKVILIASAEYEDLAHLCDRVVVFRNGHAVVELAKGDLTKERIVEQCFLDERGSVVRQKEDEDVA